MTHQHLLRTIAHGIITCLYFTDKINMFEKNDKETSISSKVSNITLASSTDDIINKNLSATDKSYNKCDFKQSPIDTNMSMEISDVKLKNTPEKVYKSNVDKFNFLQTQLSGDSILDIDKTTQEKEENDKKHKSTEYLDNQYEDSIQINDNNTDSFKDHIVEEKITLKEEINITDDIRISKIPTNFTDITPAIITAPLDNGISKEIPVIANLSIADNELHLDEAVSTNKLEKDDISVAKQDNVVENTNGAEVVSISVPPRRKKQHAAEKSASAVVKKEPPKMAPKEYPDNLNPFSDDDDEVR